MTRSALQDRRHKSKFVVETDQPPGCPTCGVMASRRKERRFQRLRDIPIAGPVAVLWSKYRWYCEEPACDRFSFFESTPQVPRRARLTGRLRDQLVDAVIRSGRAVSETAAAFALHETCFLTLPDVERLSRRMLGIDEHRFRSVRYFQDAESKAWTRFEPWMTTIVDLDTGQVLGVVDGRQRRRGVALRPAAGMASGHAGHGGRPSGDVPEGAKDVASTDRCRRRSLPLANQAVTETRQNLSQQVKGRPRRPGRTGCSSCALATTAGFSPRQCRSGQPPRRGNQNEGVAFVDGGIRHSSDNSARQICDVLVRYRIIAISRTASDPIGRGWQVGEQYESEVDYFHGWAKAGEGHSCLQRDQTANRYGTL
ncbi:transposase family protein [Arthrobacter sp. KNU40]|uniref:transposase family protein n=1 Tax=Arthrobacter sp. KNU40 TaxID=3447965 RepID=UPI003F5EF905